MAKKPIKLYLHSDKDSLYETVDGGPMSREAMSNFSRSLYEVGFDCILDEDTGNIEILSIDPGDGKGLFTR
jgi:hypothetical protein